MDFDPSEPWMMRKEHQYNSDVEQFEAEVKEVVPEDLWSRVTITRIEEILRPTWTFLAVYDPHAHLRRQGGTN